MECDICGAKDDLVKVKNEDQEIISLCRACHETQYEGYAASHDTDWKESEEEDLEEDPAGEENEEEPDDDFLEDEEKEE